MKHWIARCCLGFAGGLLVVGAPLHAETVASVKAMGMGGTAVAYGQDAITAFYNPATASFVDRRFDFGAGVVWSKHTLDIDHRPATQGLQSGRFKTKDQWYGFGEFGLNARCGCADWTMGIQWNNYEKISTKYGAPLTDFSGVERSATGLNYRVEALTLTGAYNLCESQSIGIGLNVYYSWLNVTGLAGLEGLELTIDPANLTDRGEDESNGLGVTVGWLGKFCCDRLALGFAYSPRVKMRAFEKYRGFLPGYHGLDIPETFRLGVAYAFSPCTTIAGDWEHRRYKHLAGWGNPFFSSTTTLRSLFGRGKGPGFGWDNTWTLKLGVETQLTDCVTLRAGYRHEKSPIDAHRTTDTALSLLASQVVQDFLSTGATWCITDCAELSGYLEVGINRDVPSAFPSVRAGEDILWHGADLRFEQATVSFGFAYGHRF